CNTTNESPWKGALASRYWSSPSSMVQAVFSRRFKLQGLWSLIGCGGVCTRGRRPMVYSCDLSPLARLFSSRAATSYLFRGEQRLFPLHRTHPFLQAWSLVRSEHCKSSVGSRAFPFGSTSSRRSS
ncbi:hypothetical protein PAXRUDRAFT_156184, partial [Paxillus rubicundulus Ve08.2h10]